MGRIRERVTESGQPIKGFGMGVAEFVDNGIECQVLHFGDRASWSPFFKNKKNFIIKNM
jgi:hypothetical protein